MNNEALVNKFLVEALVPAPSPVLIDFIKAIGFNPYDLNVIYNTSYEASMEAGDLTYYFYANEGFGDSPFNTNITVATLHIYSKKHRNDIDRAVFSLRKDGEWVEDPSFQYLLV